MEQLDLSQPCRQAVLHQAYEILLAGHMGKKMAHRILQQFYWLNMWSSSSSYVRTARKYHNHVMPKADTHCALTSELQKWLYQ